VVDTKLPRHVRVVLGVVLMASARFGTLWTGGEMVRRVEFDGGAGGEVEVPLSDLYVLGMHWSVSW
jgi:hypothetical protein